MARKQGQVTQAQIAEKAGVSRITVSYALRGSDMVSKETQKRIQDLAEAMGYRPNPMVSSLMQQVREGRVREESMPLALILAGYPDRAEEEVESLREQVQGMEEQAERSGFHLERFVASAEDLYGERLSEVIWSRGIQGVLLMLRAGALELMEGFAYEHFAMASFGYSLPQPSLHRATVLHYDLLHAAGMKLLEKGARRIGFWMYPNLNERLHIFQGAYHALSCSLPEGVALPVLVSDQEEELRSWLRAQRPDAMLYCAVDERERLQQICAEEGLTVWLVNLDQQPSFHGWGMSQNRRAIGAAMVDLVVGQIHRNERGIPEIAKTVLIPASWVEASSET